jgi:hypothetical protein
MSAPPAASGIAELAGLAAFAVNMFGTFVFEPSHVPKQASVVGMPHGGA